MYKILHHYICMHVGHTQENLLIYGYRAAVVYNMHRKLWSGNPSYIYNRLSPIYSYVVILMYRWNHMTLVIWMKNRHTRSVLNNSSSTEYSTDRNTEICKMKLCVVLYG